MCHGFKIVALSTFAAIAVRLPLVDKSLEAMVLHVDG
jgi:hypothetical protein